MISFPGASGGKESTCNAGDLGSIPGSGRSPGEGNGNWLQYSCLGNPMERVARGLQSMGSWTVAHDWVTNTHQLWLSRNSGGVLENSFKDIRGNKVLSMESLGSKICSGDLHGEILLRSVLGSNMWVREWRKSGRQGEKLNWDEATTKNSSELGKNYGIRIVLRDVSHWQKEMEFLSSHHHWI